MQRVSFEEHKAAMLDFNAAERAYKRRIAESKKTGDDPGDPPEAPSAKRLYTHDATWEALHVTMGENPKGMLLITNELAKLWKAIDLTGAEKAKGFFLSAWNGNDEMTLDRIIRGNPTATICLSQIGGCQPSLLRDYVRGMKGDGWLQRYGLLVYPDLNQRYVVNKTDPNRKALAAIEERVSLFANLQPDPVIKTLNRPARHSSIDRLVRYISERCHIRCRRTGRVRNR